MKGDILFHRQRKETTVYKSIAKRFKGEVYVLITMDVKKRLKRISKSLVVGVALALSLTGKIKDTEISVKRDISRVSQSQDPEELTLLLNKVTVKIREHLRFKRRASLLLTEINLKFQEFTTLHDARTKERNFSKNQLQEVSYSLLGFISLCDDFMRLYKENNQTEIVFELEEIYDKHKKSLSWKTQIRVRGLISDLKKARDFQKEELQKFNLLLRKIRENLLSRKFEEDSEMIKRIDKIRKDIEVLRSQY